MSEEHQTLEEQLAILSQPRIEVFLPVNFGDANYVVRLTKSSARAILQEAERSGDTFEVTQRGRFVYLDNLGQYEPLDPLLPEEEPE